MTTIPRVRWPFLLTAALCAVLAGLYYGWPAGGSVAVAEDMPSAAQAKPAIDLAAALPVVPASTRDRYDTACRMPTPYCITSSTLSARQLATSVFALLRARGAKPVQRLSCDGDAGDLDGPGDCSATATYRGVTIGVDADNAVSVDGIRRPAVAFVVIVADLPPPTSGPLPAWSAMPLLPAQSATPRCEVRAADGCHKYDSFVTVRMPVAHVIAAVRSRLVSWGLMLDAAQCITTVSHPGCVFGGMKFLQPGGHDMVTVVVIIRAATAGTTTVHLGVVS